MTAECDYCGSDELAYELKSDRGQVSRCIPCLAIEQGQQQLQMPFEKFVDFDPGIVYDSEEEVRESRRNSYEVCRSWWRVLARWRQDNPLVKRDPSEYEPTLHEWTREFLVNIMGSAAYYSPSEIIDSDGDPGQTALTDGGQSQARNHRKHTVPPEDLEPIEGHVRSSHEPNEKLVTSVRETGIIQPPICRATDDGPKVIDGMRRVRAAVEAGLETIDVVLVDVSKSEALAMCLSANTSAFEKSVSGRDRERSLEQAAEMTGREPIEVQVDLGVAADYELLKERIGGVRRVGDEVIQNLADHFDEPGAIENASEWELQEVDGVGPKLAKRLKFAVSGETKVVTHDIEPV